MSVWRWVGGIVGRLWEHVRERVRRPGEDRTAADLARQRYRRQQEEIKRRQQAAIERQREVDRRLRILEHQFRVQGQLGGEIG